MGFGAGDICTRLQILSLFLQEVWFGCYFWLPSPPFCLKSTKTSLGKVAKVGVCEINIGIVPFRKIRLKMWGCEITNLLILLSCTEGPSDVEVCLVQG